jgi:hypothetical protein
MRKKRRERRGKSPHIRFYVKMAVIPPVVVSMTKVTICEAVS